MSNIELKDSLRKSSIVTIVGNSIDDSSFIDTLIAKRLVLDLEEDVGIIKSYGQKNFIIMRMNNKGTIIKTNIFIDKYRLDDSRTNYEFIEKIHDTYKVSVLFLSFSEGLDMNKLKNQTLETGLTILISLVMDGVKLQEFSLSDLRQHEGLEVTSDSIFFAESNIDKNKGKSIRLFGMKNRYGKLGSIYLS